MSNADLAEFVELQRRQKAENRALLRRAFDAGDYTKAAESASHTLEMSEEVPALLWQRWTSGALSIEQLREAIPPVWINNASPARCIGERAWLKMYKAAGYVYSFERSSDGSKGTVEQTEGAFPVELIESAPATSLVVWRGAWLKSRGRGFSWTQHRECAESFAKGWARTYQTETGLYRAEIPARAVLAIYGDESEQEVVVNPNTLRGRVELFETVEPDPIPKWPGNP